MSLFYINHFGQFCLAFRAINISNFIKVPPCFRVTCIYNLGAFYVLQQLSFHGIKPDPLTAAAAVYRNR
ncbi:hypothetical protein BJP37_01020 [Moorena bouillonii PNG]|uniref:Uncharacterized protein n=1 Tax=Moorena bouillonii PNG TaxID=568701 RepID=A0A1U7MVW3_9CYAN|nr:hypothetical protein BJP37_01020 [Moorena bouillonii PNG]